jgi:hypothetical protein
VKDNKILQKYTRLHVAHGLRNPSISVPPRSDSRKCTRYQGFLKLMYIHCHALIIILIVLIVSLFTENDNISSKMENME